MLVPFSQVVIITSIEWLREKKQKRFEFKKNAEKAIYYIRSNAAMWLDVSNKCIKVRKKALKKKH